MDVLYNRLKPFVDQEICRCTSLHGLLLVDLLSSNPLHCAECKNEVEPERLGLTQRQVDDIADWYMVAKALFLLWLDSGEYEMYAKEKLLDKNGQVNVVGLSLAKELSALYPTLYWWFSDSDDGEPQNCPNCGDELDTAVKHGTGKCEKCRVIV
ncbi:MAG: DUF2310 family Zn-ribbon-containing protein [Gammaproteobacteria bacterium]|nr:DUF2310 family Zn-ribbon-containing protein [Gammaproteobacteria bacterium]MDH5652586.1 DUF2310 family Zn-ribbon-containing protein [Gammaproteobacteria bacterium]